MMSHSHTIRPIAQDSVRRLVAGQAVTDLAGAVKELVENALDAGSTNINIRLFEQGLRIVEVSDDGCGVPRESRPLLATAHATSKIRTVDDMHNATTLGFRGEALFCLANLSSNLIIATRMADEEMAQKMEFRKDGSMDPDSIAFFPKKVGTTVAVVGFLEAIPVRRSDMIRRIAYHRSKLIGTMEAYAIFSVGVKIHLMDMVGQNCRESTILSTTIQANSLQDNISSVLGTNFLSTLCEIHIDLSSILAGDETRGPWNVMGMVSKAGPAATRGLRDRQFFSINKRPVDLPKVSRILNAVWKKIMGKKKPSCILQFTIPTSAYNVNLSPDKREVHLTNEDEICKRIEEGVTQLWSSQTDGKFAAQSVAHEEESVDYESPDDEIDGHGEDVSPSRFNRRYAFSHDLKKAKLQHEYDDGRQLRSDENPSAASGQSLGRLLPKVPSLDTSSSHSADEKKQEARSDSTHTTNRERLSVQTHESDGEVVVVKGSVTPSPGQDLQASHGSSNCDEASSADADAGSSVPVNDRPSPAEQRRWRAMQRTFNASERAGIDEDIVLTARASDAPVEESEASEATPREKSQFGLERFGFQKISKQSLQSSAKPTGESRARLAIRSGSDRPSRQLPERVLPPREPSSLVVCASPTDGTPSDTESKSSDEDPAHSKKMSDKDLGPSDNRHDKENPSTVTWDSFAGTNDVIMAARKERLALRDRKRKLKQLAGETVRASESGTAGSDPSGAADGERILALSKDDFQNMTVIGQFNLGFILVRTPDNNIWILDQHACDEKYNFEKLFEETVIREQKLIAPMPLELTPAEETCVLDHLDIFEKNGFRFQVDWDRPPRHRLSLTGLPHSGAQDGRKAVQFGKEDVSALCAILSVDDSSSSLDVGAGSGTGVDGSGLYGSNAVRRYAGGSGHGDTADKVIVRLPKAIAMFASRACRSSIMIGKALSPKEMDRVVKRLMDVEHPWNCPHGRPTMRHVGNLNSHLQSDEDKTTQRIIGATVAIATQEDSEE